MDKPVLIKDLPIDEQAFYCSWHHFKPTDRIEEADSLIMQWANRDIQND